jgi:IS30 family transposase
MVGHSEKRRDKTGPALAGHGASAVRDAIVAAMNELPKELRHTLTWDQGAEMAQYERLSAESGLAVYFCNPHSPWQRGTNENTNGLLRQYFPKGTNLSRYGKEELDAIATALNRRPRKTLNWRTPEEVLTKFSQPVQNEHVASTG